MRLMRYLPRFRRAYQKLETLAAREGWSRPEIEAFQLDRLNAVWQDAIAHVPYYRHLAAEQDLPPRFSSLAEFRSVVPCCRSRLSGLSPGLSSRSGPIGATGNAPPDRLGPR